MTTPIPRRLVRLGFVGLLVLALGWPGPALADDQAPPPLILPRPRKVVKRKTDGDCSLTMNARVDEGDARSIPDDERDKKAAQAASSTGIALMREADIEALSAPSRRKKLIEAVGILLDGLERDPYSPSVNYNLAAAYARLARRACMLKFLKRVVGLSRRKATRRAALQRLDQLRGSANERPPIPPDPDFNEFRDDPTFVQVVGGD